jgi:hypothetical protein
MKKYDKEKQLKYLLKNKDKIFNSIWPEQEIVRYIAQKKFDNSYEKFEMDEMNIDANSEEFQEKKNKEISKYENDLMKLDIKNLSKQFIDIEESYYSRYRSIILRSELKKEDFKFWNRKSSWSIKDLVLLKNNINPNFIPEPKFVYQITKFYNFNEIVKYENLIKTINTLKIFNKYEELVDLLEDSKMIGDLNIINHGIDDKEIFFGRRILKSNIIKKNDLMNWCKENDISLPKEFLEKKSISELEEENQDLKNQITNLQKKLKEKEDQRVIKKLYQIICGMTKKHYSGKKPSVIKNTLDQEGINLDLKTIRKHIEKALEEDQSENGNI